MQTALSFVDDDAPGPRAELNGPAITVAFMLAGNAHVTFQSRRTGTRFTYRVRAAKPREPSSPMETIEVAPLHFVSVLTGSDNEHGYEYLGCIYARRSYAYGRKSRITTDAPSAVAFAWVWRYLSAGRMHPELAVYHEGRCGVCARRLTTSDSILRGIGPTCWERMGGGT